MVTNSTSTRTTSGRPAWKHWSGPPSYGALASYVVTDDVLNTGWTPLADGLIPEDPAERVERARIILEETAKRFAAKEFPYRLEPWRPTQGQWIRDPLWFEEMSGTCLDFATVFAAGLLQNSIAPVIAIALQGETSRPSQAHAFLLVDLERDLSRVTGAGPVSAFETILAEHEAGDGSVTFSDLCSIDKFFDSLPSDPNEVLNKVVAVDPTAAAGRCSGKIEEQGRHELLGTDWDHLVLVDVARRQRSGQPMFEPLRSDNRPVITRHVPPLPTGVDYQRRPELEDSVKPNARRVLVYGVPGVGKSLFAQRLAATAVGGCGWFLNCSDRMAMMRSLALAESEERSLPDSATTTSEDITGLARLAAARLREAGSWLVVLDNCDGNPSEIVDLLPAPGPGQVLIITTNNREWLERVESEDASIGTERWDVVHVGPMSRETVMALGCPESLIKVVDGRPLFAETFARATRHAPVPPPDLKDTPGEVDDAAWLLWEWTKQWATTQQLAALRLAAWLQPDAIPADTLTMEQTEKLARWADQLQETGVVARFGAELRMHRLVGTAVRADTDDGTALQILSSEAYRIDGAERADADVIERAECRIDGVEGDDHLVAKALWALMGFYEFRGSPGVQKASSLGQRIEEILRPDAPHDQLSSDGTGILADALMAQARWSNQRSWKDHEEQEKLADCRRSLERAREAAELRRSINDDIGVAKSVAMEALLLPKTLGSVTAEERLAVQYQAIEMLEKSRAVREEKLGTLHPDTARAIFNLGGRHVNLAQMVDSAQAPGHLDSALDSYEQALELRRRLFRSDLHPHIAACVYGQGVTSYLRAILLPLEVGERVVLLREATDLALRSLAMRQSLDGKIDASDTVKSTELAAKVLDARSLIAELRQALDESTDKTVKQAQESLVKLLEKRRSELVTRLVEPLTDDGSDP